MSELKDVITAYRKLPFGDRVVFYSTVSNDVDVREETVQDFLIETVHAGQEDVERVIGRVRYLHAENSFIADAAYQIIKLGSIRKVRIKEREQITKLKVA